MTRFGRLFAPLTLTLAAGCGSSSGSGGAAAPAPADVDVGVVVSSVAGELSPIWRDHYDLSFTLHRYADDPDLMEIVRDLEPRSWRCSVGRWEVGSTVPGGDSLDPAVLGTIEREFYRGANTLAAADDPASYDFGYLDRQLDELTDAGVEPYLCFDYVPFTLSSEQDPRNAANVGLSSPGMTFSNGIRTAPPADPQVYARVVRNVIRHVQGRFKGGRDFGVTHFEVGNEPDLVLPNGQPLPLFWAGTRQQWIETYAAVAAEVDADPDLAGIRFGGGSFAMLPHEAAPRFVETFLAEVAGRGLRLDFLSFHSYGDDPAEHRAVLDEVLALVAAYGLDPELVNGEWGRALDGADPVYSSIEHGKFRAEALFLMASAGVRIAHAAPFGDPGAGQDLLGTAQTVPAGRKPVTAVYEALGALDGASEELAVDAPGASALAGRTPDGGRVVVALVAEGGVEYGLRLEDLDAAGRALRLERVEVREGATEPEAAETRLYAAGTTVVEDRAELDGPGGVVVWTVVRD